MIALRTVAIEPRDASSTLRRTVTISGVRTSPELMVFPTEFRIPQSDPAE